MGAKIVDAVSVARDNGWLAAKDILTIDQHRRMGRFMLVGQNGDTFTLGTVEGQNSATIQTFGAFPTSDAVFAILRIMANMHCTAYYQDVITL